MNARVERIIRELKQERTEINEAIKSLESMNGTEPPVRRRRQPPEVHKRNVGRYLTTGDYNRDTGVTVSEIGVALDISPSSVTSGLKLINGVKVVGGNSRSPRYMLPLRVKAGEGVIT